MDFTTNLTPSETKGFLGERYDTDAGLQYLNARYYDPALAMFIQPDWFEVTMAGVGTNRYAYSFNDPINKLGPSGNAAIYKDIDGDGENEYYGQVNPGDPGYDDIVSGGPSAYGMSPSDWVDFNNSITGNSVAGCAGCQSGGYAGVSAYARYRNPARASSSAAGSVVTKPNWSAKGLGKGLGWLGLLGTFADAIGGRPNAKRLYYHYTNAASFGKIVSGQYGSFIIKPNRNGYTYVSPLALPPKAVFRELFGNLEWHKGKGGYVIAINPYPILENGLIPDNSYDAGIACKYLGPIVQGVEGTFVYLGPNPF